MLDPGQEAFLRELQQQTDWREPFSDLLATDDGRVEESDPFAIRPTWLRGRESGLSGLPDRRETGYVTQFRVLRDQGHAEH